MLLFHGRASAPELESARTQLASAFTGSSKKLTWTEVGQRYRPIRFVDVDERRVIVTRALSNAGVTPRFLSRLAALVRFMPEEELPGWDTEQPVVRAHTSRGSRESADMTRIRNASFLDEAAAVFMEMLGIAMRKNGSQAESNNRMGTFARRVKLGVVVAKKRVRVHLHSNDPIRHAIFGDILAELDGGSLKQPSSDITFQLVHAPKSDRDLRYLESAWADDGDHDAHGERIAAIASWLTNIRHRFP